MVLFPYCKINLGLQILAKRPDGFHDLDTVFLPVKDWYDVLEILPAAQDEFILSGAPLAGDPADNLVCRAREALRRYVAKKTPGARRLPACRIHLHKRLPAGAGLGGGSSDATHTLIGLNRLFDLGLSTAEIEALSHPLGSDCAFFGAELPARATGKGDRLERLTDTPDTAFSSTDCHLWIVVPPIPISTPQAYAGARPQSGRPSVPELLRRPLSEWPQCLENDFEKTLFPQLPVLKEIKDKLYGTGAFYASLSGSGSALFGLFHEAPAAGSARIFPADYISFQTRISIPSVRK